MKFKKNRKNKYSLTKKPVKYKNTDTKSDTEKSQIKKCGVKYLTIDINFAGQRIDNYLRRILPNIPKSRLYQMLRKGEVRLNKKRVKAESRVNSGDILRIPPTFAKVNENFIPLKVINKIKESVLHKDNHFMIIDKPAGLAVHSGSRNTYGLIDVVSQAFPEKSWYLCHRLDKDTSGCLVLAGSRNALNIFQNLSINGDIHKQYLALVKGKWIANQLCIDNPVEKAVITYDDAKKHKISEKKSISIFTTQECYAKTTLMQVVIKTGKTHQIRIHAAKNKYPIAMDNKYGDFKWNRHLKKSGLSRMFLHAHVIRFKAFGEIIHTSAELPKSLQNFIKYHQDKA